MLAMDKKNTGMSMAIWIIIALMAVGWILTAWVADDAYITFRTIDHFWKGYGLRWNIDERVQVFTHPLWMMLLSIVGYPFRELYYSSLALSAACVAGTLTLLYRHAASQWQLIIGLLVLLSSRAFIDFSSSGLENPLLYLLGTLMVLQLSGFYSNSTQSGLGKLTLLMSLLFITRMDSILLFIPPYLYCVISSLSARSFGKQLAPLLLGALPAIGWSLFSIFYFGSFIPNTAWAKLNTGIGKSQLLAQGFDYYWANLVFDPVTLCALTILMAMALVSRHSIKKLIGLGCFITLCYIASIGADYMYGRFLSVLLVIMIADLAVDAEISFRETPFSKYGRYFFVSLLAILTIRQLPNWNPSVFRGSINVHNGMADERGFYYFGTGLWRVINGTAIPKKIMFRWYVDPQKLSPNLLAPLPNIGMFPYLAPDSAIFIDPLALSDPFLAQHPMRPGFWRQGHFERSFSMDYLISRASGVNQLKDPDDYAVLKDVWLATRAPLFAKGRLGAIWRINTGQTKKQAFRAFSRYKFEKMSPRFFPKQSDRVWYGPYRP